MARAWIEFAQETEEFQTETDQVVVTTRTVVREVQRDPRPPAVPYDVVRAIVAPRRSRVPFYIACILNWAVFVAGVAIWIAAGMSDADLKVQGAVGGGLTLGAFIAAIALSSLNPRTCTCPNHMDILGCDWAAERQAR